MSGLLDDAGTVPVNMEEPRFSSTHMSMRCTSCHARRCSHRDGAGRSAKRLRHAPVRGSVSVTASLAKLGYRRFGLYHPIENASDRKRGASHHQPHSGIACEDAQ